MNGKQIKFLFPLISNISEISHIIVMIQVKVTSQGYFYNGFLQNSQIIYSGCRLIGSRIIESAAYCNQNLLAHLYLISTQITSVNWIIRLLLSLLWWPKVILLSGRHCSWFIDCYQYLSFIGIISKVVSSSYKRDWNLLITWWKC